MSKKKGIFAGLSDDEALAITLELNKLRIDNGFEPKDETPKEKAKPFKPITKVLFSNLNFKKKVG